MTEAAAEWKWTEPADKTCWKDLVVYSKTGCADADKVEQTDVPATLAVGKFGGKTYLKSCSGTEIVIQIGDDETAAKAATESKIAYTHEKGKVKCLAWGSNFGSFTAVGWAEAKNDSNSTNATGAKSLAAAMAAGALAVAATQF